MNPHHAADNRPAQATHHQPVDCMHAHHRNPAQLCMIWEHKFMQLCVLQGQPWTTCGNDAHTTSLLSPPAACMAACTYVKTITVTLGRPVDTGMRIVKVVAEVLCSSTNDWLAPARKWDSGAARIRVLRRRAGRLVMLLPQACRVDFELSCIFGLLTTCAYTGISIPNRTK